MNASLGVSRQASFGDVSQVSVALVSRAGCRMLTLVLSLNSDDEESAGEGLDEIDEPSSLGCLACWGPCAAYVVFGLGGMDMWGACRCGWINMAFELTGTPGGAIGGGLAPDGRRWEGGGGGMLTRLSNAAG
jgi:hypothetical protein